MTYGSRAHRQTHERSNFSDALAPNLLIEAAAGTSKTTRLIAEIVDAITTGGARVPAIAVLTFTEKAAGELKLRLRSELESAHAAAAAEAILQL